MFQFPGFASNTYVFSAGYSRSCGFPHSDIVGSKLVRSSPTLFAAYHVLHRLSVPRHPPNALIALDFSLKPVMYRDRSEEHTSELQSLMRISYAVFCLKKKNTTVNQNAERK